MSSSLTTLVPVLDGTNYQFWSTRMTAFLMSQGQHWVLRTPKPEPVVDKDQVITNADKIEDWELTDAKAFGNIHLRLHYSITSRLSDAASAAELWGKLKEEYGKPGLAGIFADFKLVMDTRIPYDADPAPAIDAILAAFGRLNDNKVEISEEVRGMMLFSKIPPSMNNLAQFMNQNDDIKAITFEFVRRAISLDYESRKVRRQPSRANKLSAVKRQQGEPSFSQQQQQRPQQWDNARGRGGRERGQGKRGGRKFNQQQQGMEIDEESPFSPPSPNPSLQQQYAAGPSSQGYAQIASPLSHQLPPPFFMHHSMVPSEKSKVSEPLPESIYPSFAKALKITKEIGVKPTIETVKTIETAELNRPSDPRPKKKRRALDQRIGSSRGESGKVKAPKLAAEREDRDEVVSLGGSEDCLIEVFEQGTGIEDDPMDYPGEAVRTEDADFADIFGTYEGQVQSLLSELSLTEKLSQELKTDGSRLNTISPFLNKNPVCLCSDCKKEEN